MIESKRNQLGNAKNSFQGDTLKALCVCSAGLLRSPTIAKVLSAHYNYNVRACGTDQEYALIPISTALLHWADLVVFADREHYEDVREYMNSGKRHIILDLPDDYSYDDEQLVQLVREKLKNYLGEERHG